MTEAERIGQGQRAAAAMAEFLTPAFDVVRLEFINRLSELASQPVDENQHGSIVRVALAVKVLDQVKAQIEAVVRDGEIASNDILRARKIESIPAEKRKILGIGINR